MSEVEYSQEVRDLATNAWANLMAEKIRPDFWRMFHWEPFVKVLEPDGGFTWYRTDPRVLEGPYKLMLSKSGVYHFVCTKNGRSAAILSQAVCFSPISDAHPIITPESLRHIEVPVLVQ